MYGNRFIHSFFKMSSQNKCDEYRKLKKKSIKEINLQNIVKMKSNRLFQISIDFNTCDRAMQRKQYM